MILSEAQRRERLGAQAVALDQLMRDTQYDALLDIVEAHIKARPDSNHIKLEQFCNRLGREAWAMKLP